jgi:mono/diheme cytochrome c family protein
MTNDDQRNTENADPHEQHNPIPKVVLGLVFGLVVWAVGYIFWQEPDGAAALGDHRVPSTLAGAVAGEQKVVDGSAVFANSCQACHQATGQGLPGVFPPLAGSNWVLAPPDRIAQILLHGVTGPIEVLGATYNGAMPAFGSQFSDAEIAAVASFVRKQWGNSAEKIAADQVAQARKATIDRMEPWPGGEGLTAFFSKNSIAGEGPK